MDKINKVKVFYKDRQVGTIACYEKAFGAFQYTDEWLTDGFSISPYSLPLDNKVYIPDINPFYGMYGVFNDSLPDGWGRLLVDRLMRKNGIDPTTIGNLERLAIVGNSGLGALTYEPVVQLENREDILTLDAIAEECTKILKTEYSENLDEIVRLGGSSGGARPKIMTNIGGEEWIIKFPSSNDYENIGKMEYDYAMCAKACGIEMAEVKFFNSKLCQGYFGTKRFDREKTADNQIIRKHMVSASGLLETSHRIPNLDYELLMKLTLQLTDDMEECEKLFRLMCFNVFAHNRDDHSKNFTYMYDETEQRWHLSPAYDLTYSNSIGGEHATTIHGEGANPGLEDILSVAKYIGISTRKARNIAENVEECVRENLREYLKLR